MLLTWKPWLTTFYQYRCDVHYIPQVHLQCPPNQHFRWKIWHFYGNGTDKNTAQNSQKQDSPAHPVRCPPVLIAPLDPYKPRPNRFTGQTDVLLDIDSLFQANNSFLHLPRTASGWKQYPSPHPTLHHLPNQAFSINPCIPQNSSQIYAAG